MPKPWSAALRPQHLRAFLARADAPGSDLWVRWHTDCAGLHEYSGDPQIVIAVAILFGVGIMVSVANSGTKENIQIDRK